MSLSDLWREGEFADAYDPAEFHHLDAVTTGLWIVEWDWSMKEDEDTADTVPAYSEERWSRPSLDDLVSFGMLEAAHV